MNRSTILRLTTTIIPPIIVAGFGILTYLSIRNERLAGQRVELSHDVIDAYEALLADVRDAQNSTRGFVITGNEAYLTPFTNATEQIDEHAARLARLVGGDGSQLEDFKALQVLVEDALAIFERSAQTRRDQGEEAALAMIATGRGELLTARIREIVAQGLGRERNKLEEAGRDRERRATFITVLIPLGTAFAVLLGILLNGALARFAKLEEQRNEELRDANAKLMDQQIELELGTQDLEEATDALSLSEARFRGLIEHSFDIVAATDANGVLTYISPSVKRILGNNPDHMVGRTSLDFVHPDDRRGARALLVAARRTQAATPFPGIVRVHAFDGGWRTLTFTLVNLLDDPAVNSIVINARDVTESRLLEEQLLQSQKMEAVGRLAGGIAHDFNNLITTIKGHLTFALDDLGTAHPVRADLDVIDTAADRAASLTKQLLAFSRRQVMEPRTVDVNDVVIDFERMIRRVIGEDIEVRTRLSDKPQFVRADPHQLQQMLMNLTVNARDAMPRGGTVTIDVRREERDAPWPGETDLTAGTYVMLAVADNGTGMPPEVRDRVFEPFFTTKESGKGTGLGLAMVYGIVKQSGGHIHVYSEPGQGTTFKVYLPLAARVPEAEQNLVAREEHRGDETVLLVEDEPSVRSLAARALSGHGYEVIEARNGREALSLLESNGHIDLLLSDVIMPEMRGQDLVDTVRRDRPGVRVILMSGYTDTDITKLSNAAYIEKPFTIAALLRKVRETLDNGP